MNREWTIFKQVTVFAEQSVCDKRFLKTGLNKHAVDLTRFARFMKTVLACWRKKGMIDKEFMSEVFLRKNMKKRLNEEVGEQTETWNLTVASQ